MTRRSIVLLAALAAAGANATAARADLCFRYGSGGGTLVAKNVTVPAPNKCKQLAMFESGGGAGSATGSICTDWTGATIIYHYDYDGCVGAAYRESATCRLQLSDGGPPSRGGACKGTANTSAFTDGSLVLTSCNVLVPAAIGGLCASRAAAATAAPHLQP